MARPLKKITFLWLSQPNRLFTAKMPTFQLFQPGRMERNNYVYLAQIERLLDLNYTLDDYTYISTAGKFVVKLDKKTPKPKV